MGTKYTPTQPIALPELTSWPLVIGIIAMSIGGLGILGGILGTAMVFAVDFFLEILPEGQAGSLQAMAEHQMLFAGIAVGGLLLSILLVASGLMTVKRKGAAFGLFLTWAVLATLFTFGRIPADQMTISGSLESIENGSTTGGQQLSFGFASDALAAILAFFPVVYRLAFPVFILIWLARRKIRQEMRSW